MDSLSSFGHDSAFSGSKRALAALISSVFNSSPVSCWHGFKCPPPERRGIVYRHSIQRNTGERLNPISLYLNAKQVSGVTWPSVPLVRCTLAEVSLNGAKSWKSSDASATLGWCLAFVQCNGHIKRITVWFDNQYPPGLREAGAKRMNSRASAGQADARPLSPGREKALAQPSRTLHSRLARNRQERQMGALGWVLRNRARESAAPQCGRRANISSSRGRDPCARSRVGGDRSTPLQDTAGWTWEVARIRAKSYTNHVPDLMVEKLGQLPDTVSGI